MSNISMDHGYELTGDELESVTGAGNFGRAVGAAIGGYFAFGAAAAVALVPPVAAAVYNGIGGACANAGSSLEDSVNGS
jgi:hypothetical protein